MSCNKNNDNNPASTGRDWFKLKTVLGSSLYNGTTLTHSDSTSIEIDSFHNKIILKEYSTNSGSKDTSIETYTYDNSYKLVLYEHVDTYNYLYISRMEFVRDANGQVIKVLSGYKNSLLANSEGTCKYEKRGDTTLITYLDSTKKHTQGYPDAQDYYQVALLNDKIAYYKSFVIKSAGYLDTSVVKLEYDASGSLIADTEQYGRSTPVVYTYQRGSESPKELQKFVAQLAGDLIWFNRTKLFSFSYIVNYSYALTGNVLQSIKKDNAGYLSFTNGFDGSGNLSSVSYQTTTGSGAKYTIIDQYKYRP